MRHAVLLTLFVLASGCRPATDKAEATPPAVTAAAPGPSARDQAGPRATVTFPLRVAGTGFVDRDGRPFRWHGVTAFRLAEMIASGRERDAIAYLDWAASEQLTVVRVLLMAQHLFKLTPDAGRGALPRLLDLAAERGIAVEAVALADTAATTFDIEGHIREVGRIAAVKGNAIIEIANEPGHASQDARLHDAAYVKVLADLIPAHVVVALGSVEYGEQYSAGDYATLHSPRGKSEWDHVTTLADGASLVARLRKPVVSDEPIGAGPERDPGRRDNDPSRFAAAAALSRFAGMGATFHYEGGLQATIPQGREAACFAAWQLGLALAHDLSIEGEFVAGGEVRAGVARGGRRTFARVSETRAAIMIIDPGPSASVTPAQGWREVRRNGLPGVMIVLLSSEFPTSLPE